MHSFALRLAAVAIAVGLTGVACDDEKSGLTKADWMEAASAICTEASAEFNALIEASFPTTLEATAAFFGEATPILEQQVADLKELDAPEEIADDVDAAIASGERAAEEFADAVDNPEQAGDLFEGEGGENLEGFVEGFTELGVPSCDSDEEAEHTDEEQVDAPDPSTFSPEKQAFVEAGDALCVDFLATTKPAEEQYLEDFPPPMENWVGFLGEIIPAFERFLADFEELQPPADDAAAIAAIVDRQRGLAGQLDEMKSVAEAGDQEAFAAVSTPVFEAFDEADIAFQEYGFQECGADEEESDEDEDAEEDAGETETEGEGDSAE